MTRSLFAGVALALVVGAACRSAPKHKTSPQVSVDVELVRTLTVLATSQQPEAAELDGVRTKLATGTLTIETYIDELVRTEAFAAKVAPLLVLRQLQGQSALGAPQMFILSKTEGADPVYYIREPCAPDKAVAVRPWWNYVAGRDETVKVCPDSYLPERWTSDTPRGEPEIACLSESANVQETGALCGCGPNLMRCYESRDMGLHVTQSLRDELTQTIAHVARHDLPLETIFTANETFRDPYAEFIVRAYSAELERRPIAEAALAELASWPRQGKWAPRPDLAPGHNAGILTAPQVIHYQLDRRQRMTAIYDVMWCVEVDSVGASPESMLAITGANLQLDNDGWKELAGRAVCTGCHARLDYGMQFFWGFANGNLQSYFVPALQQKGRGPLYSRDIDDPRGDAELTPHGFASLAVSQPEFRTCMARDFVEYTFGNDVTPLHVSAVEATIQPRVTTARDLMRTSLRAFATAWANRPPAAKESPAATSARPAAAIAKTGPIDTLIDQYCIDCHDQEADRIDLAKATLARTEGVSILESVAFGRMPKDDPLPEAERRRFVEAFIHAMWADSDARAARAYYVDRLMALPAFRPEVAFSLVHRAAGAPETGWNWRMMESSVRSNRQQLTPGLAAVTGLAAIGACRAATKTRAERDACIAETLRLDRLTGTPVRARSDAK